MHFRNMDQSDPSIQEKMMQAYDKLLSNDYVSDLSPARNWLAAFTEYAQAQERENLNSEGFVRQGVFYDDLGDVLDEWLSWLFPLLFESNEYEPAVIV